MNEVEIAMTCTMTFAIVIWLAIKIRIASDKRHRCKRFGHDPRWSHMDVTTCDNCNSTITRDAEHKWIVKK